MTDAQQKKIVELYKSGISVSEIVKKIKVSKASVYRIIKDLSPEDTSSSQEQEKRLDDFEDEEIGDADSVENTIPGDEDLPPDDFSDDQDDFPDAPAQIKELQSDMSPELQKSAMGNGSEFLKSIELLGELNRELMQNSMSNFDKAVRAMEEMLERFQKYDSAGLRSAVEEVNALIDPLHAVTRNEQKNLPLRTAVFFIVLLLFLFTGFIFGLCSYSLLTRYFFGTLLAICGIEFILMLIDRRLGNNDLFAWISSSSFLASMSLFTGYYLGLMDWLVFENWLLAFLLFPAGCLTALPFAIWRRRYK